MDLGVFQVGSVIEFSFNTSSFTDGSPITLAGSPAIKAYRDHDTTTETTDGLSLTTDFDGVTGRHHVTITTTADGFWQSDSQYHIEISAGTVGGTSVAGKNICRFDLSTSKHDGALCSGTAAGIANGTITLASGHGLGTVGSLLIALFAGTDAKGKSRLATYSGSGDVFNVDPAWNAAGEALPSGTIKYRVFPAPPAPTTSVPSVTLTTAGVLAVWNQLTTDVGLVASSFGTKLRDWVLGTDNKSLVSTDAQDLHTTLTVGVDAPSIRAAVGEASANLDTQITALSNLLTTLQSMTSSSVYGLAELEAQLTAVISAVGGGSSLTSNDIQTIADTVVTTWAKRANTRIQSP